MNQSLIKKNAPSVYEKWLCLFLFGILVLIAGVIFAIQHRYDVGQWREQVTVEDQRLAAVPENSNVKGLVPVSSPEQFDAATLSDKINGKADLYLTAGFKQLESRRFGLSANPGRWMERYVYHMDGFRNAFAVFSVQRRENVEPIEVGGHAYVAGNGLFIVHGSYYIEIIAAEVSELMRSQAIELANSFIAAHPVEVEPLTELQLFPKKDRVPNSTILNAASLFGLEGLDWVFSSRYAANGHEATAFISSRVSALEADNLAAAFIAYWRDYGGETVVLPEAWAAYQTITILDNYEMVWVQGEYLVGVHEATDLEFGMQLAEHLRQAVREGRHGS